MLENSLHASVDVISREIRFMSVNPGFVEFDGSFQVMLFHIPKLISGVDISSKSAEVVYGFDPDKSEESYRAVIDLWTLDGDYCIFRWTIPFTFFAEKRWAFFQVRIRTTSGTTVESQWSTKLKKVYVTPGFTGGQEAYTQAQQDAIAALNSRVTALEASGGGSGSIQLQVDQTPTENSQNLVTSGGVWQAIQEVEPSGSSEDSRIPTPTVSDNGKVLGVVDGVYALKTDETGSGGSSITVDDALSATSENPVQNKVIYQALQNSSGGSGSVGWRELSSSEFGIVAYSNVSSINNVSAIYCAPLGLVMFFVELSPSSQSSGGISSPNVLIVKIDDSKYYSPNSGCASVYLTSSTNQELVANASITSSGYIYVAYYGAVSSTSSECRISGLYYTNDLPT